MCALLREARFDEVAVRPSAAKDARLEVGRNAHFCR
jgi:hypothetical protein